MAGKASFGSVRKLPSGRWQARYTGPDGSTQKAPLTYDTKKDAETYLASVRTAVAQGTWQAAPQNTGRAVTLREYAPRWLAARRIKGRPLADRTRSHYTHLLDRFILPTFGDTALIAITPDAVTHWYETAAVGTPTYQAHAYTLLKSILATAADPAKNNSRPLIPFNPAGITGAGRSDRVKQPKPASLAELETLVTALPDRYRLMAALAAWCALRFGELAALQRRDIDLKNQVVKVRRAVVRADGQVIVKKPKSAAGERDVAIPPHLMPMVRDHLLQHTQAGAEGLLFPAAGGGHLATSTLYRVFTPAREAAGRPDLRFHDLRHAGATLAAQTGATLAELMARLGHSTPAAAMRYQHAAAERDTEIAAKLSAMVESNS